MSTWKRTSKKRKRDPKASASPVSRSSTGRVHLVLQRDVHQRAVAASLSAPLFAEDWQNTLTLSAVNTALTKLKETADLGNTTLLAQEAMDALSKFTAGLMAQLDAPAVACTEGCDHCCHQSVGVTPIEALTIVNHLRSTWSPESLTSLVERVHAARLRTEGLTAQQRFSPQHPCPLLVEGRCSVYAVRPLSCRATNSLTAEQCRNNLHDPDARATFLKTGKGPDSLIGPYRASHALSAGLQMCLSEVYGLDMQPLDLIRALDELLQKPNLAQTWLSTGLGLEGARGGDGSSNAHLLQVAGVERR